MAVYAVVRIDKYFNDVEDQVAVQAVLPSIEEARAEIERLNAARDPDRVVYVVRATRFYPEGRAAHRVLGAEPSPGSRDIAER
jgi:hypothetical protein